MRHKHTSRRRLLQLTLQSGWLLGAQSNLWPVAQFGFAKYWRSTEWVSSMRRKSAQQQLSVQELCGLAESPNGSSIPIIDSNGTAWTIIEARVAQNNVVDKNTANVAVLLYWDRVVYHVNWSSEWYMWIDSGWIATTDPREEEPPEPSGPVESEQGATLTSAEGALYDASLDKWTLVESALKGLQIAFNDQIDDTTGSVVLLLYWSQLIYQQNAQGGWWFWAANRWNDTTDPRVQGNANVTVNLTSPTGKAVPNTLFGFCGGGLCYGNSHSNNFDVVFDQKFQASAAKLKPALIRFNTQQTEPMFNHIFRNGTGNPDWEWLDNWVYNHAGFFNDKTNRVVFGIGPAFSNISIPPSVWAERASAVAKHLRDVGQECFWWELGNEPDGSGGMSTSDYNNYFNAMADALHSVNPDYKCGGPVTSYWGSEGYDKAFLPACAHNIGYAVWHVYGFHNNSSYANSAEVYQQAIRYGDISNVRNTVNSYGLGHIPLAINEYNMVLDNANNSVFDAAMFSCLFLTGAFQNDPLFTMTAVWDLVGPNGGFSCIGNSYQGDNSHIDPQGWYLGLAGQYMPGDEVSFSTQIGNLKLLASKTAQTWALQICNYEVGGSTHTLNIGLTGANAVSNIKMMQMTAAHPDVTTRQLGSLSGIACPSQSITILTGSYR